MLKSKYTLSGCGYAARIACVERRMLLRCRRKTMDETSSETERRYTQPVVSAVRFFCAVLLPLLLISVSAMAAEGEPAVEEKGIFSGTFADSLWTVAAFVVLIVVLGKVAWKPLLNQLQARQDYIKQQLEAAEITRKKAEELLDQYKQQGAEIVNKLTSQAQLLEKEMVGKARDEITQMKRRAQADVEYARIAASQQMWQEAEDMLLSLSSEIVGRAVTHEDNLRLLCQAIEKLKSEQTDGTR